MQDFGTKANDTAGPSGQLSADEFNNLATELENAVLRSGQALNGASVTQLAQSLFLNGTKAESFQDSGLANAYVATPVSGASGTMLPTGYALLGGASITFQAANTNTTFSTLNIGQTTGTLLGTKFIRTQADLPLPAGVIVAGQYVRVVYRPDFLGGAGAWALMPWTSKSAALTPGFLNSKMVIDSVSATATLTADSITTITSIGGTAYQISNFSSSINLGTTGAGGMDTGAAPVNGWVALYAIYNPSTGTSALLARASPNTVMSAVYGGVNMPAGFTASVLLTVVPTGAGGQFKVLSVFGRQVYIQLATAFSGATINANTSITAIVPANALEISGELQIQNTSASAMSLTVMSQTATAFGQQNFTKLLAAGEASTSNFSGVPLPVPQNVGIVGSSSAGTATYTVFVSRYMV